MVGLCCRSGLYQCSCGLFQECGTQSWSVAENKVHHCAVAKLCVPPSTLCSPANVRKAFPVLLRVTNELCDVLAGKVAAGKDVVEMSEAAMRVTLDVLGPTAYGCVAGWLKSTACLAVWLCGDGAAARHINVTSAPAQSTARCYALPLHVLCAVCRYDFKARTYAYCEMFEVRQPAPSRRPCQRLLGYHVWLTIVTVATACTRLLTNLEPITLLALTLLSQIIPPLLGEFTLRSTNPLRPLMHRCLPFLPAARKYRQRVKVCCGAAEGVTLFLSLLFGSYLGSRKQHCCDMWCSTAEHEQRWQECMSMLSLKLVAVYYAH